MSELIPESVVVFRFTNNIILYHINIIFQKKTNQSYPSIAYPRRHYLRTRTDPEGWLPIEADALEFQTADSCTDDKYPCVYGAPEQIWHKFLCLRQ